MYKLAIPLALTLTLTANQNAEQVVSIGDNTNYTIGSYLGYLAPFNKGRLVAGTDYTEEMIVRPHTFPDMSLIKWEWPAQVSPKGIYNFDAIDFGNANSTVVEKPVPSIEVNKIQTLTEIHKFTLTGELSKFDVITDIFLTTKPGDSSAKSCEIEIFWHTPTYSKKYFNIATPVREISISGVDWMIAVDRNIAPRDVLIMPRDQSDLPEKSVDLGEMLKELVRNRVISSDDYFNGLALGVEVQAGKGSMSIEKFEIKYN